MRQKVFFYAFNMFFLLSNFFYVFSSENSIVRAKQKTSSTFKVSSSYFIPNQSFNKSKTKIITNNPETIAFIQTMKGAVQFTPKGAFIGMVVREDNDRIPEKEKILKEKTLNPIEEREMEGKKKLVVMGLGFGSRYKTKSEKRIIPKLEEPTGAKVNFYIGKKENWQLNVPTYKKLIYPEVWDGINVKYIGYMDKLEYRVIVKPYSNPEDIVMETGAENLQLNEDGSLTAELKGGKVKIGRPYAYQEIGGEKVEVPIQFKLLDNGRYTFEIGDYDRKKTLIIDPTIEWSTYLGGDGDGNERGQGIVVDSSSNVYVTGYTGSPDFPVSDSSTYSSNYDVFILKYDTSGSMQWATILGGSGEDKGKSIAIDSSNNLYITGFTASTDFPVTDSSTISGQYEAFVCKYNSSGSLQWSTFLGGSDHDIGKSIAVDSSDNAYITGYTSSINFPVTDSSSKSGYNDVFITKYNSSGTRQWSTLLGGSSSDYGQSIAIDSSNNVYINGYTHSSNFPVTDGSSYSGANDVFIAKYNSSGTRQWSTLLGGSSGDYGQSVAVDSSNNVYINGYTYSSDFPVTDGSSNSGNYDVFITKYNSSGTRQWSTLLGGNTSDYGYSIAIDSSDNVYITGGTYSSDFPVTDGSLYSGNSDVFIAKYNSVGARQWATRFGGTMSDFGYSIAIDSSDNAYITGYTASTNFPVTDSSTYSGNEDVFIAKYKPSGAMKWSTYLGATAGDYGYSVAIDGSNNVYIAGYTYSSNFPVTDSSTHSGNKDIFITKFNSSGNIQWSTFLGGSDSDAAISLTLDNSDNSFITGYTASTDFPVTDGSINSGEKDVFIIKLNSLGNMKLSILVGGGDSDYGKSIVTDNSGNIYITGSTYSTDFPVTDSSSYSGISDVFIAKYNSIGTRQWSTLLGGSDYDHGQSIAVDDSGNPYIAGDSTSSDFPVTDGSTNGGSKDVVITKYNSSGVKQWAIYLGGSLNDSGQGIDIDSSGNAYITGETGSSDFPVTDSSSNSGTYDAFIAKYNSSGIKQWATYLGGNNSDGSYAIAVDNSGNSCITGFSASSNFPVTDNSSFSGVTDVFVAQYNSSGNMLWSTLFGGSSQDYAYSIVLGELCYAYVAGYTHSTDFPTTSDAYDTENNLGDDVFITKFQIPIAFFKYAGGSNNDGGNSVIQTDDGGYIVAGYTSSYTNGGKDIAVYKYNCQGTKQWFKHYGGSNDEECYSIIETSDGGYALCGYTLSYTHGGIDVAVYKLDSNGNVEWFKYLGGSNNEVGYSIIQTSDGGYAIAGYSTSYTNGGRDALVYKLDSSGTVQWYKHLGGTNDEEIESIVELSGGGYLLCGYTLSYVAGSLGNPDVAVYKLDSSGNKVWFKHLGGSQSEEGTSIIETSDGGYAVLGYTESYTNGSTDIALWKFDNSNTKQWFKHFGGSSGEEGYSLIITNDGGYAFCGYTMSYTNGGKDIALYKVDSSGTKEFFKHYGGTNNEFGNSLVQTSDGGYLIGGVTNSYTHGGLDLALYKLRPDGTK